MEPTPVKRQLAGRKTAPVPVPHMPAQIEAIQEALVLVQDAVNNLLAENLAGETGPVGIPSQIWLRMPTEAQGSITAIMERTLLENTPSVIPAKESDVKLHIP